MRWLIIIISLLVLLIVITEGAKHRAYYLDPKYCQEDADCFCVSGSGVPFTHCSNYMHAPDECCRYYRCNICTCQNYSCVSTSQHLVEGKFEQI